MLKILLLIAAVSVDGFVCAVGIGSAGIKIPARSAAVISLTGTVFLTLAVAFADMVSVFLAGTLCTVISSLLLILLGIFNLCSGIIRRRSSEDSPLSMLFDGAKADTDRSKTISCREALGLAVLLSADSLVTGVSVGLGDISLLPLIISSFVIGFLSVIIGGYIGKRIIYTGKINLQWVCGIILIIIALLPWLT